jgi:hypothetical protein
MRTTMKIDAPTLAFQIKPFCKNIGIGTTKFYELLRAGKIRTICIGKRRLIPVEETQRIMREGIA